MEEREADQGRVEGGEDGVGRELGGVEGEKVGLREELAVAAEDHGEAEEGTEEGDSDEVDRLSGVGGGISDDVLEEAGTVSDGCPFA